jgi:aldehyde dehydrogenase (NAD(P)+)
MLAAHPGLGADVAALRANADGWARLAPADRERLLDEVAQATATQAARWARAGANAKGVGGTALEGEEWISGPWALLYALTRYRRTLAQIAREGVPHFAAGRVRTRPGGRTVADVFPVTAYDRVLLSGVRAEVWMQDGVTPANLDGTLGVFYQTAHPNGRVALVLGAGNIAAIPPLDVLYKLIADGCVCLLKMNPVNEYLAPVLREALAPLLRDGYVRIVTGGTDVGAQLCEHPDIDEIHITGSERSYDAIVFGTGPDAADRKRRNDPILAKRITSELGNISPTIVVPGDWSAADFAFQAENIVTQKLHNAGFNCVASQVLVLPADWSGTPTLLAAIESLIRRLPPRPQYYPGSDKRHASLVGQRAAFSGAATLVRVAANADDEVSFTTEAFCDVLAATQIGGDIAAYVGRAVAFANDRLHGTLGANLIVHPATERAHAATVDAAIADLRYGCVAVNTWTGVGFLLTETPWGAYPGHTRNDVGSGIGVVHNAHLFSRSQKSVVRAPFAPFPRSLAGYGATLLPRPPWFVTNRMAARIGPALCDYELRPSWPRLAKVAALAMRG